MHEAPKTLYIRSPRPRNEALISAEFYEVSIRAIVDKAHNYDTASSTIAQFDILHKFDIQTKMF